MRIEQLPVSAQLDNQTGVKRRSAAAGAFYKRMPGQTALLESMLLVFGFFGCAHCLADGAPQALNLSVAHGRYVAPNGDDANPGTADRPWATINYAAQRVEAGDTIVIRGGEYVLHDQIRVGHSGRPDAWITFVAYPGEHPLINAKEVAWASLRHSGLDNGAFQIERVSYIRVAHLTIENSHDAGFTIRDSSHIDLINDSTTNTYSSGIAVWDTNHTDQATTHVRILGNTIVRATSSRMGTNEMPAAREPPHEAISVGGAVDFEVAYNDVRDSEKEGIDVKETSKRGTVHGNFVHGMGRQGLYVDAWFGAINDIKIYSNVIEDCHGAGLAISVENGRSIEDVDIRDNLIFNNDGSGVYFSRWGVNHERRNIKIHSNTIYHNGFGAPKDGQAFYWMTGGIYLYSDNLRDVAIWQNIVSGNNGFQIGYSELFLKNASWEAARTQKNIRIFDNLIAGQNAIDPPIESGGDAPDRVKIYATNGVGAVLADPMFRDAAAQDFGLRTGSPAILLKAGRSIATAPPDLWWKRDFPPMLLQANIVSR
jgi:Right handed beta helix region